MQHPCLNEWFCTSSDTKIIIMSRADWNKIGHSILFLPITSTWPCQQQSLFWHAADSCNTSNSVQRWYYNNQFPSTVDMREMLSRNTVNSQRQPLLIKLYPVTSVESRSWLNGMYYYHLTKLWNLLVFCYRCYNKTSITYRLRDKFSMFEIMAHFIYGKLKFMRNWNGKTSWQN